MLRSTAVLIQEHNVFRIQGLRYTCSVCVCVCVCVCPAVGGFDIITGYYVVHREPSILV